MSVMSEWLYPRIHVGADEDYLSQVVTDGSLHDVSVLFGDVGLMVERAAVDLWRNIRITQEGDDRGWSDWHAQMLRAGMMFYECLDGISPIAALEGYRHGFSTRAIADKMMVSQTSVRRWIEQERHRRRPPAQHAFRQRWWDRMAPPAEWGFPSDSRMILPDDVDMPGPGALSLREGLPPEPRPEESVRRSAPVMRGYLPVQRLAYAAHCALAAGTGVANVADGTLEPGQVDGLLLQATGRARRSCGRVMAREILVAGKFYFSRRCIADDLGLPRRTVGQWQEWGERRYGRDCRHHEQWRNGEVKDRALTWIERRAEETYRQFLEAGGQVAARPAPPFFDRLEEAEQPAAG